MTKMDGLKTPCFTWKEVRKELFTPEEIAESENRIRNMHFGNKDETEKNIKKDGNIIEKETIFEIESGI